MSHREMNVGDHDHTYHLELDQFEDTRHWKAEHRQGIRLFSVYAKCQVAYSLPSHSRFLAVQLEKQGHSTDLIM